jgi:hypothetical protein
MTKIRVLLLLIAPLTLVVSLIAMSWVLNKESWYFRGYEYYSDWVYPGLANPNIEMRESGDSAREYLFDSISKVNRITLNEYGDRTIPCSGPTVVGLGDSQMFGSGLDDRETFPYFVYELGGPCMYNAGRHSNLDALRNAETRTDSVIVTSTERDGFTWYCEIPPSDWDLTILPSENFILRRSFSIRASLQTGFHRTVNVLRSKIQNAIALRINAPSTRIIKFQHSFSQEDVSRNLECVEKMNQRFNAEGIRATYMLFPAAQTLFPKESPKEVDDFTLAFIPKLSELAHLRNIDMLDSRSCLKRTSLVTHQLHDTHLSAHGMKVLAECYVALISNSSLGSLDK